ncbi:MAG: peptidoglycan-binding protein [Deltaproteobacteria bacterium]|nr:peptidoglycan-binding protein [Deltaproteobacteria bacterium]
MGWNDTSFSTERTRATTARSAPTSAARLEEPPLVPRPAERLSSIAKAADGIPRSSIDARAAELLGGEQPSDTFRTQISPSGRSSVENFKGPYTQYSGTGDMRLGHKGEDVKTAQRLLQKSGVAIDVDRGKVGYYGPNMYRAVKAYQAGAGLTPSGVLDQATQQALNGGLRPSTAPITPLMRAPDHQEQKSEWSYKPNPKQSKPQALTTTDLEKLAVGESTQRARNFDPDSAEIIDIKRTAQGYTVNGYVRPLSFVDPGTGKTVYSDPMAYAKSFGATNASYYTYAFPTSDALMNFVRRRTAP